MKRPGTTLLTDRVPSMSGTGARTCGRGFGRKRDPGGTVQTDISFSWPERARREAPHPATFDPPAAVTPFESVDPDAGIDPDGGRPAFVEPDELVELRIELADARRTIARLEADRRTARLRIEELEDAERRADEVIVAQRRRLVLLERRLED